MTTTLHAIIDPLCGWCYAAESLLEAAAEHSDYDIKLHCGGMLIGSARRRVDANWRAMVLPADKHISELSGQKFGDEYKNALLNTEMVLDSEHPITALLTARLLGGNNLSMLSAMQKAYYIDGRNISDQRVLMQIASELGYDDDIFKDMFQLLTGKQTMEHIKASRKLLEQVGGQGFPTMFIQQETGSYVMLMHSNYYGQPVEWLDYLANQSLPVSIQL